MKSLIALIVCLSAGVLNAQFVTSKPKGEISNKEVITSVNTNSTTFKRLVTMRPAYEGEGIVFENVGGYEDEDDSDDITNAFIKVFMQFGKDTKTDPKALLDMSKLDDNFTLKCDNGSSYSGEILYRAKTIDIKLGRKMNAMSVEEASSLPVLTSSSTLPQVIAAYETLRQYLVANSIEEKPTTYYVIDDPTLPPEWYATNSVEGVSARNLQMQSRSAMRVVTPESLGFTTTPQYYYDSTEELEPAKEKSILDEYLLDPISNLFSSEK